MMTTPSFNVSLFPIPNREPSFEAQAAFVSLSGFSERRCVDKSWGAHVIYLYLAEPANQHPGNLICQSQESRPQQSGRKRASKSQRKSTVVSALASLEPFSGTALVAAAQEGLQALKEKERCERFVSQPLHH